MKNLNKLFSGLLLMLGALCVSSPAHAVWYKGTPKEVFVSSFTTGPTQITPSVSTTTLANNPNAAFMPGALYQVTLSSGAASEFIIIVDTTNCVGITVNQAPGQTPVTGYSSITPRLIYGSTTANTVFTFDPPIRFDQGLCIVDSAQTGQAAVTYELGRGIGGQ
jgi:hypothetical protein